MPRRVLFCQHCGDPQEVETHKGELPNKCGGCGKLPARWSTEPIRDLPAGLVAIDLPNPLRPYRLTKMDEKFLHSIRIDPEMSAPSEGPCEAS